MARKNTARLDVEGNAKKKLADIAEEADKVAAGFGGMGKASLTMAGSIAIAEKGLSKILEIAKEGKEEFMKTARAVQSLNASLKASNASNKEIGRSFDAAENAATKYNLSLSETTNSLSKLINASGDAKTGQDDLQRAIKISKTQNMEMAEAVQILAEARKGEVEGLKKLRGFDKKTVDGLSSMSTGAARTSSAFALLNTELAKTADVAPNAAEGLEKMDASMKKVSSASAGIAVGMGKVISLVLEGDGDKNYFDTFATAMTNWSKAIQSSAKELDVLYEAFAKLDTLEFIDAILSGDPIGYAMEMQATNPFKDVTGYTGKGNTVQDPSEPAPYVKPEKKKRKKGKRKEEDFSGFEGDFDKDLFTAAEEEHLAILEKLEQDRNKIAEDGVKYRAALEDKETEILQRKMDKRKADILAFEESKADAQMIALDASVGIAEQVGLNEAAVAGIRAAIEVGEGLAALAPTPVMPFGNPAGAAAHFAAAAQFGVAAAMSGAGGGGGVPSKGGGGAASLSANRDKLNAAETQPTETNINLDFSRSLVSTPAGAKEVANMTARGVSMLSKGKRLY